MVKILHYAKDIIGYSILRDRQDKCYRILCISFLSFKKVEVNCINLHESQKIKYKMIQVNIYFVSLLFKYPLIETCRLSDEFLL